LDREIKQAFQVIIFSLLFILLFLILMPPLMGFIQERWGKILYGVLVAGAFFVALRLRLLARKFQ